MKFRMLSVATLVLALAAVSSLRAEDEKKVKCPVSGQPAKAAHTAEFNGGKVAFCCPNCLAKFEEDSEPFAAKANLQLFQTEQLKQVKCPLTGRPMADDKIVEVEGEEVAVCCGGCLAKAKKASGDELIVLLFKDTTKGFEAAKK